LPTKKSNGVIKEKLRIARREDGKKKKYLALAFVQSVVQ